MSHHASDTPVQCPNCNYPAVRNYCAQCGQPVHLHDDTFLGLVGHFFAHYFHYESRFWKTLRALWGKPGSLTIAFRLKQRARYTDPLSLYFFISFFYFLVTATSSNLNHNSTPYSDKAEVERVEIDNVPTAKTKKHGLSSVIGRERMQKILTVMSDDEKFHKIDNMSPKIFFFMVPLLAVFLNLFYIRRRDIHFVDHVVFSLHFQAFYLSMSWLPEIMGDFIDALYYPLFIVYNIGACVYMTLALHRVYNTSWFFSAFLSFVIMIIYFILLTIILISLLLYLA